MSRGFASNYRIVLLATGLLVCFAALSVRLVGLHVIDRDALLQTIVKTRRQVTLETARRGNILDARGAILATSRPLIVLAVDPMMVRDEEEPKWRQLAKLIDVPYATVREKFTTRCRPAKAVPQIRADWDGPGVSLKLNLPGPRPATAERVASAAGGDPADPEFVRELFETNVEPEEPAANAAPAGTTPGAEDAEVEVVADTRGRRAIRWARLSDSVTESAYAEIEKLRIAGLCPPERRYARVYPHEQLAAHLVGYANREGAGVAGIEGYADFYLRGQDGWREGEKDGRRRELAQFQTRCIPRSDGYSVVLSIDSMVQDIIERELDRIAKTYQPLKATIVVSDPRSGFILGMANHPTFDPNEYNLAPMAQMRNVAVADVYEPGSVFKIVAASAALEEGVVGVDTTFDCTSDRIVYKDRVLKLPGEDHHFDHDLTVAEIISRSSNRGAAQLAMRLGDERFERYARAFGFGETLGFPVGGEVRGIFWPRQKWNPGDITRIPMGQSIAATALQMHQAMAVIAADGLTMRPQVIREMRDPAGNVVYRYGPVENGRVISRRTARTMARLLQGVAGPGGTAMEAAIRINGVDYEVAGKTGTAQKYLPEVQPNGTVKLVPSRKHHVVSFVGFFPASRPQVAISVIVDDADARAPGGVAYGAKVAAPVFRSIGEKLIPILPVTPTGQPARLDIIAAAKGGRR